LWRTYIMLTDLKPYSQPQKRNWACRRVPQQRKRAVGNWSLPYWPPVVQIIRRHLKESGIDLSWNSIRRIMASQCRVTASFRRGRRTACMSPKPPVAEPEQLAIYRALNLDPPPDGVCKLLLNRLTLGAIFQNVSGHMEFLVM